MTLPIKDAADLVNFASHHSGVELLPDTGFGYHILRDTGGDVVLHTGDAHLSLVYQLYIMLNDEQRFLFTEAVALHNLHSLMSASSEDDSFSDDDFLPDEAAAALYAQYKAGEISAVRLSDVPVVDESDYPPF